MKKLILLISSILILNITYSQEISFTKITSGDIVNDGGWNYAMSWSDFNGDGYPDLFITNNDGDNGKLNFLYLNNGDGTFEKITAGSVVTDGGSSYACTAADINGDWYPDLFVGNYNENNFLYLGNGDGTFEKVTEGAIVSNGGKSAGAAWADYNLDGYMDLYVANRDQQNFLYKGIGGGEFEKITGEPIVTDVANSSACAWGDYNNDNYPDLYIANSGSAGCLYKNNGDESFSKVQEEPFISDISSSAGASWGDCDNDGDLDLFVATGQLGMYNNMFYKNNGDGTFTKITDSPVINDQTWAAGSAWGDYDKDGDLDLAVAGYDGDNQLFQNDGSGNFLKIEDNEYVNDGGYTEGLAWADIDDDGDLDIFTAKNNYFGGNNSCFLNNGNTNNWIKIKPVSDWFANNSQAIGAKIYVYATISGIPVMQMREVSTQSGGGQGGQNEHIQFFGLGDANIVDSLKVEWNTGSWSFYAYVINQTHVLSLTIDGIEDLTTKGTTDLNLSPNPTAGEFQISIKNLPQKRGYISITDLRGKEITRISTKLINNGEAFTVDPHSLSMKAGTYLVHYHANENKMTKKIVLLY